MLSDSEVVRISKYLSQHLRHRPERLGLELEPGGWLRVDALLDALRERGVVGSRAELDEVVARNDKQRFAYDATRTRIRASQGHSVAVDLGYAPLDPPEVLYHGTNARVLSAVLAEGLSSMGRHHVHLSPDARTARRVGARRGRPVVLEVAAGRMAADGHVFLRSANGVWLTAAVPPAYLRRLDDAATT